jgi:hypothetical protein
MPTEHLRRQLYDCLGGPVGTNELGNHRNLSSEMVVSCEKLPGNYLVVELLARAERGTEA